MASRDQIGSSESGSSQQELEFRRILNLTPQMITVLDADGRTSWQNEFALDYFGISLADLMEDDSRARPINPDDLLWNHTVAVCGQRPTPARALRFDSRCRAR
jgi:PAS domain-containing protein